VLAEARALKSLSAGGRSRQAPPMPGDTKGETGATVHWHRHDGTDAVVLVTADVFKAGK
jgi:hypothetical protein